MGKLPDTKQSVLTRIGLISDTHGYLDQAVFEHFKDCHEIWHAGDFGSLGVADSLRDFPVSRGQKLPLLRGVHGNIDGSDVKSVYPEQAVFMCEGIRVLIRHIGGYPPNYNPATKKELLKVRPRLFISGHSHILKIMYDEKIGCLHINPGAAGKQGWQKVRTLVRLLIDGEDIRDCEVIELP